MNYTRGPWRWRINRRSKSVELVAYDGMGTFVMGFSRYGMRGAQPMFNSGMFMVKAHDIAVDIPGQEHNNEWNQTIKNPDAKLIASAPQLLETLTWPHGVTPTPEFLELIADRLVLHGDRENSDFIISLRARAAAMREAIKAATE